MVPRTLTERERLLTCWMIEHGSAAPEEKQRLLAQLARALVVRTCPCGCPTVDFAIDDKEAPNDAGLRIVGDFLFGEENQLTGVFVFVRDTLLAGVEVYALSGATPTELPLPAALRPFAG